MMNAVMFFASAIEACLIVYIIGVTATAKMLWASDCDSKNRGVMFWIILGLTFFLYYAQISYIK